MPDPRTDPRIPQGAAYTRSRRPGTEVYRERKSTHGAAIRREIGIKRLTRGRKESLIRRLKK